MSISFNKILLLSVGISFALAIVGTGVGLSTGVIKSPGAKTLPAGAVTQKSDFAENPGETAQRPHRSGYPVVQGGSSAVYMTDLSNDQKLVGSSHNIFIGKILERVNWQHQEAAIQSEYAVKVLANIKGNLEGTVDIYLDPGGNGPEVGATYLLAARYGEKLGKYVLSAPEYDRRLIAPAGGGTDTYLVGLAERDQRVLALRTIYPAEVLDSLDVRLGKAWNSYASRCLDANGELIDDTVQIANEKNGLPKAQCVTRLTPEARPIETPVATPVPSPISKPKTPLPSVEPVRTPPPPPAIPGQ